MNFNEALEAIKAGKKLARQAFQKKATVYLVHNRANNMNHIEVRTLSHCLVYAASSADLLANDWYVIGEEAVKNVEDIQL